ncbi:MAG: class I SAM-dependent methyltransferase [Acidobacteria bacterium]|nr:MAG: class I SAM-dependent methyltransferase [Acidobacteriota bacterium]
MRLLPGRPREFFDRIACGLELRLDPYLRARPSYSTQGWADILARISQVLGADMNGIMAEDSLSEIESTVRVQLQEIPVEAPFPSFHNGDFQIARLSYALVRALSPSTVIETGVCYGVTSAFILKALERNGGGTLYSIDLPPLGSDAEGFVGWLIPRELRARWRLFLGTSRQWLPKIVGDVGEVDMFLHDSLHTYGNISKELRIVTPRLCKQSVVVADDIEGNSAFLEWASRSKPAYRAIIAEDTKSSLMGIGVFTSEGSTRPELRA